MKQYALSMSVTIEKIILKIENTSVNALVFIPTKHKNNTVAVFTHGFTSHKGSILNWASRLCSEGATTLIFDQPGHFLGSFNEVESFDSFKQAAPELFNEAFNYLKSIVSNIDKLIIGGHSLGALTSLLALEKGYFDEVDTRCICVGFGLPPKGVDHVFKTPFYKSTLNLRGQLVSNNISPEVVFPWIKEAKESLSLTGFKIHFITGEDDLVVGKNGTERFVEQLSNLGNHVSLDKPNKLPHHMPELSAGHIKKYLKDQSFL